MTVHSFWQQALDENASTTRKLSQLLWPGPDGVRNESGSPLLVQAQATPDMTVKVNPGWAKKSGYLAYNDVSTNLTIGTANALLPRIDLIVMRWLDTENGDASAIGKLDVIQGTPNASPSAPSTTGMVVQVLAQVLVAAATTTIAGGAITDVRALSNQDGHVDTGWLSITPKSGYTNVGLKARRIGDVVFFRGELTKNTGNFATVYTSVGTLPDARLKPVDDVRIPIAAAGGGSTADGGILFIGGGSTDVQICAPSGSAHTGYWMTGVTYPAA